MLNHAIHMAAISQISKPATSGRVYYDKKLAEGKTGKEALRALKRRISDTIYRHLAGRPAAGQEISRGNQERLCRLRGRPHILNTGSSAQPPRATPKPTPDRTTPVPFNAPPHPD